MSPRGAPEKESERVSIWSTVWSNEKKKDVYETKDDDEKKKSQLGKVQFAAVPTMGLSPMNLSVPVGMKKLRKVPLSRTFSIALVEVTQLTSINIIKQEFGAQFYIEFRIHGAAEDEELNDPSDKFPFGIDGKPTFLPSAKWYLGELDFNNALTYTKIDSKVRADGDDLVLTARFEGTFMEPFELHDFPFDVQDLTMSLAINCRTSGMTPVEFAIDEKSTFHHVIKSEHFPLHNEWQLHDQLTVSTRLVGGGDRLFPTIDIAIVVERKPQYYLVNIVLPMAMFALMGSFQSAMPRYETADRFNVCFSLLLTIVAFKFSIATMLPAVTYLTLLDKFVLACSACIILACFEAGAMGLCINLSVDAHFDRLVDAHGRRLRSSSDGLDGGDEDDSLEEEEVLWATSRASWARSLDHMSIAVNMTLIALIVAWFYTVSSGGGRLSAKEKEKALADAAIRDEPPDVPLRLKRTASEAHPAADAAPLL